jgi:hypothetical protein
VLHGAGGYGARDDGYSGGHHDDAHQRWERPARRRHGQRLDRRRVPVGVADAEADARRSGADDDERHSNVGEGLRWTSTPGKGPTTASPWAAPTRRPTG